MCFIEKIDHLIWVNLDGFEQRLMLRLQLTPNRKGYNDYFTIERPLSGGAGAEVLYKLRFEDISDVSYQAEPSGDYTICIEVPGADLLRDIHVVRHCFNYFGFRKMMKIYRKSKKALQ